MSYPAGHEPSPADGVEGLLTQIAEDINALLAAFASGDAGDATAGNQATEIARLDSILAKIIAAPSTEAKQDTQITAEQAILAALNARLGKGAANLVTSEVTAGAVATLVVARPTRRSVLIRNYGTSTDVVSVGEATVSTTHGTRLKAGESCAFTWVGLIQVLAITGTPIVTAADEYD